MKRVSKLKPCDHKFARTHYVPSPRGTIKGKRCKCGHVEVLEVL